MAELLRVNSLVTQFKTERDPVKSVDGVSYYIDEEEIIGLVGENGWGKSVSQLSVMQIISVPVEIVSGKITFEGQDLLKYEANGPQMCSIRGAKIAMIFQKPMPTLNPVLTIGQHLTEMLKFHLKISDDARNRTIELMSMVGISDDEKRIDDYPHDFSGWMRQRVMIAVGLSCNPKIVIADEPTTSLDVTTRAQLLGLMKEVVGSLHTSLIIVTHNMGIVARYVQRLYIMYASRIVESGSTKGIFTNPRHS